MLSETTVPGTDDWWLMRLAEKLGAGFPRLHKLDAARSGDSALPEHADPNMRKAYRDLIELHQLNFAETILGAVTARQRPVGFRTAAASDEDGDLVAQTIWDGSRMAVQSRELFDDVGVYGNSFTGTSWARGSEGAIRHFTPWEAITEAVPGRPWESRAALFAYHDAIEQQDTLVLMLPGRTRTAVMPAKTSLMPSNGTVWYPGRGWTWAGEDQYPVFGDLVPFVQHRAPRGKGQFEPHMRSLNRINHTILQKLTITAMQAFRQRGIQGDLPQYYPPDHPQAGQKIDYNEIFSAGPAALWMIPSAAEIWESAVTDITPIITDIREELRNLAAASSTPLYVLAPDAAGGSAEGAALAREMLTFKVDDLNTWLSASLAEQLGHSFLAMGDRERSEISQIEVIWQPTERSSWTERSSAAAQASTTLSRRMIQEKIYQLTPAEIRREKQYLADDAFATPTVVPNG